MKNHTKYLALITSTLLVAIFAGPANAAEPVHDTPTVDVQPESLISAASTVSISYEKPAVNTLPAPAPVVQAPAPVEVQSQTSSSPIAAVTSPGTSAAEPAVRLSAPTSGRGATISAAAYAQLGVAQDCTALVSKSLLAAGINFHGWPAGYLSLGAVVSADQAKAGDLAYYVDGGAGVAHIAVYVGGGMAVHGGWNGGTTSLQSVNIGSGPVFIRVA